MIKYNKKSEDYLVSDKDSTGTFQLKNLNRWINNLLSKVSACYYKKYLIQVIDSTIFSHAMDILISRKVNKIY